MTLRRAMRNVTISASLAAALAACGGPGGGRDTPPDPPTVVATGQEDKFGVKYHPNYLREWLTKRRHTPQKPVRRAKQRNPVAIASWLADEYPAAQKKSRRTTPISS